MKNIRSKIDYNTYKELLRRFLKEPEIKPYIMLNFITLDEYTKIFNKWLKEHGYSPLTSEEHLEMIELLSKEYNPIKPVRAYSEISGKVETYIQLGIIDKYLNKGEK